MRAFASGGKYLLDVELADGLAERRRSTSVDAALPARPLRLLAAQGAAEEVEVRVDERLAAGTPLPREERAP